jgi:hypothetical protein
MYDANRSEGLLDSIRENGTKDMNVVAESRSLDRGMLNRALSQVVPGTEQEVMPTKVFRPTPFLTGVKAPSAIRRLRPLNMHDSLSVLSVFILFVGASSSPLSCISARARPNLSAYGRLPSSPSLFCLLSALVCLLLAEFPRFPA